MKMRSARDWRIDGLMEGWEHLTEMDNAEQPLDNWEEISWIKTFLYRTSLSHDSHNHFFLYILIKLLSTHDKTRMTQSDLFTRNTTEVSKKMI